MKRLVFLVLVPFALCGCGGGQKAAWDPTGEHKMAEIAQMLKALEAEKNRRPPLASELDAVEPFIPLGAPELRSGEIVYQWGVGLTSTGSDAVLAYEKKGLSEGGWVLMQDGTVKRMSADELRAAPKAK